MDQRIAEHLKRYHRGERNAITNRELEAAFGIKGRDVRNLINRLRRRGVPICSCAMGYYYADTEAELTHTIRQLLSRSREIAAAGSGMMKALPMYRDDGQLSLLPKGGDDL